MNISRHHYIPYLIELYTPSLTPAQSRQVFQLWNGAGGKTGCDPISWGVLGAQWGEHNPRVPERYGCAGDGAFTRASEDKPHVKACRFCYRHFLTQYDIPTDKWVLTCLLFPSPYKLPLFIQGCVGTRGTMDFLWAQVHHKSLRHQTGYTFIWQLLWLLREVVFNTVLLTETSF